MKHLLLSVLERVAARLPSAVLMLMLAFYVAPAVVGLYAWMIVSLTFAQAAVDVPLRHIAVEAISTAAGRRLLRRLAIAGALASVTVLALMLVVVGQLHAPGDFETVVQLAPLVGVPLMTLGAIEPTARLQAAHRWNVLAGSQATAALVALTLTLPLLLLTGSIVAPATQPLIAEFVNLLICRARAGRPPAPPSGVDHGSGVALLREWWGVQAYSLLGWAQGQADRVFVGLLAGASALGSFSYANALGRTGADAAINAGVNVARIQLQGNLTPPSQRASLESASMRMIAVCVAGVFAVWALAELVLPAHLDDSWGPALSAAPILATSAIPAAVTWHMSLGLVIARRTRLALPARALGVLAGLAVAWAAISSLPIAALVILARELVVMTLMTPALRGASPVRSIVVAWVVSLALAGVLMVLAHPR